MIIVSAAFALYLFGTAYRPLLYAGFAVQSGYLLWRGITLERLPLVGVHDTLNFLGASLAGFSIAIVLSNRSWQALTGRFIRIVSPMAAAFTAISLLQRPHDTPLPPVLRTYWFELHVAMSFISYALFGIAAAIGAIYLMDKDSNERDPELERLQYKTAFVGYGFFSISMIFGGIWAYLAWGTYWLWTPKELWTTILWIFYSLYLHARLRPWWQGRPSAILGIVGFGVVLFTYLGVGLLMKSSHAF